MAHSQSLPAWRRWARARTTLRPVDWGIVLLLMIDIDPFPRWLVAIISGAFFVAGLITHIIISYDEILTTKEDEA